MAIAKRSSVVLPVSFGPIKPESRPAGLISAGAVSHLPLGGADNWMHFRIEGQAPPDPGHEPNAPFRVATPGYFETMGIPLRSGRVLSAGDARRAVPLIR